MYSIHKYMVRPAEVPQAVLMPKGARIISAGNQAAQLVLWAVVDPEQALAGHLVAVYGTGWDIPSEPGRFVNTVQVDSYVWHVFDCGEAAGGKA